MATLTDNEDQAVQALLPWYVNGRLSPAEQVRVEQALQHSPTLVAEVELLKTLRAAVKAQDNPVSSDLSWQRLQRDIRREKKKFAGGWRPAFAVAALVVVIQAVLLVNLWERPSGIKPLGGLASTGVVLQVSFSPQASEAQLRASLQTVQGQLIGGPGALGIYRVRLPLAPDDEAAIQAAVKRLQSQRGVITHVARE